MNRKRWSRINYQEIVEEKSPQLDDGTLQRVSSHWASTQETNETSKPKAVAYPHMIPEHQRKREESKGFKKERTDDTWINM